MKTNVIKSGVFALIIILVSTISVSAQRSNKMDSENSCCTNIPGLTAEQKSQIASLEQKHQADMETMRTERRNTGTYSDRDAYQNAVEQKVQDHRNSVRSLLDEDQKTIFDNLHANANQGANSQTYKGQRQGQGNQQGSRGNGRRMGRNK
ncbi:MAG TPA: hypothetical protein DCY35_01345 [Prolixibacteraceae bacterium]|nr:hypothetical protein [Prolixibacteraceae bacterium]